MKIGPLAARRGHSPGKVGAEDRLDRLGVGDVPRAVEFWCAALNYKPLRRPSDDWAILVPAESDGPQMAIAVVSSDAANHQRHHVDLYATRRDAEVDSFFPSGPNEWLGDIQKGRTTSSWPTRMETRSA